MKAAIYARVSTANKDQNPETQSLPPREFAAAQGWMVAGELADRAPATDLQAMRLTPAFRSHLVFLAR